MLPSKSTRDYDDLVRVLTSIVREIDPLFEAEGGSTRHWVRDFFLPELERRGLWIVRHDR